jgi:chromate transporter
MSPSSEAPTAPAPVSLVQAFGNWLKLGFISFGGPAGQIALMHQDLVERKRWISERRFLHALNFCMLLPGPEAQQLATYIGWLMHRTWGGIIAGTLFVLPSLLILIGLSWLYLSFGQTFWATALLHGVKPAVTAIVLAAAYRIGSRTLNNGILWTLAMASFVGIYFLGLPFPLIALGAALLGALGGRIAPAAFRVGVILNLAVLFAGQALWPNGVGGDPDWLAASIIPAGLLALIRYRWGVLAVMALSGLAAELPASGRFPLP